MSLSDTQITETTLQGPNSFVKTSVGCYKGAGFLPKNPSKSESPSGCSKWLVPKSLAFMYPAAAGYSGVFSQADFTGRNEEQ